MADLSKSSQILPEFENFVQQRRDKAQEKADSVFSPEKVTPKPVTAPVTSPEEFAVFYENQRKEVDEAIAELVTESADRKGSMKLLQAVQIQSDHVDTYRRAESMRVSPRLRRKVFAAARRRAHAVEGGYYDRKLKAKILALIKEFSGSGSDTSSSDTV